MSDYLIYQSSQQPFDKDEAYARLKDAGVSDLRLRSEPGNVPSMEGTFELGDDSIIVKLNSTAESFALSDRGPAAHEFAVRLQAAYDVPLHIIDIGYTFDLLLKDYPDADALTQAILAAWEADDEEEDNDDNTPPAEE